MSRQWITLSDVSRCNLGDPVASMSKKGSKKITVVLGYALDGTPHVWKNRKQARKWVEALTVAPVWREGAYYEYLYEGVAMRVPPTQPVAITDDELAFEGDIVEPTHPSLDAATTFETPTEASLSDLDSKSHVPVAEALAQPPTAYDYHRFHAEQIPTDTLANDDANLEEWAARTRDHAEVRHQERTQRLIDTVNLTRDPPHSPDLTTLAEGVLSCPESVYAGPEFYLCSKSMGHGGAHQDAPRTSGGVSRSSSRWVRRALSAPRSMVDSSARLKRAMGSCTATPGRGTLHGVPNEHDLLWTTADDDEHHPSYGAARSALAGDLFDSSETPTVHEPGPRTRPGAWRQVPGAREAQARPLEAGRLVGVRGANDGHPKSGTHPEV